MLPAPTRLAPTTAERNLVACVLREPAVLSTITVRPEHFSQYALVLVFGSCVELYAAGHEGGTVGVYEDLHSKGQIADLGDNPAFFLQELLDSIPVVLGVEEYAAEVRSGWTARQFKMFGERMAANAGMGMPADLLLAEAQGQLQTIGADVAATPRPERFEFIDTLPFLKADFRREFLIDDVFVRGQPAVGAGPVKSLKTTIVGVDMAISLATGKPFLGHFRVPKPVRVVLASGESGAATLQETARRVMTAKFIDAEDVGDRLYWCLELPKFPDRGNMREFASKLKRYAADVVIIDPVYQCIGGEVEHQNVIDMGALYKSVADELLGAGCTPMLLHHANRQLQLGATMQLHHIAYSGLAEFARQFILLNRITAYAGGGVHDLRANIGGSAGHGALWDIHVEEGTIDAGFQGRRWDVTVKSADEARARVAGDRGREKDEAARQKMRADETDVLTAIDAIVGKGALGATKNKIMAYCPRLSSSKLTPILDRLIEDEIVVEMEFKQEAGKGAQRKVKGYCRPREEQRLCG